MFEIKRPRIKSRKLLLSIYSVFVFDIYLAASLSEACRGNKVFVLFYGLKSTKLVVRQNRFAHFTHMDKTPKKAITKWIKREVEETKTSEVDFKI